MSWKQALDDVARVLRAPLEREGIQWAIIGSAATALQGCRVSPADIDILTTAPKYVRRIAALMSASFPARSDVRTGDEWQSSEAKPVNSWQDSGGLHWHLGRWFVRDVKVEVAHIATHRGFDTSHDGGMWEAWPAIWAHVRGVEFGDHQLPVVPLEIQLQTSRARGLTERVEQIVSSLRNQGCDGDLLSKCLADKYRDEFQVLLLPRPGA